MTEPVRRALLVLSFALAVIPGGIELAEEVVCLAVEGHADEDGCADECAESGCRPGSHACSCCAAVRVAPSEPSASVPSAPPAGEVEWPAREGAERPSFAPAIARPPRA